MKETLITLFLILVVLPSCRPREVDFSKFDHVEILEIAPDTWLKIYFDRQNKQFIFRWAGKTATKKILITPRSVEELLLSLREKEGDLYMIVLNREDIFKVRYDFFKLRKGESSFKALDPKDYPKDIATQNRLLPSFNSSIGANGEPVDDLQMLRDLDVNNVYFMSQSTPKIWVSLETGKQKYEIDQTMGTEECSELAKSYKKRYKPISLKNIVAP